MWKQSTNQLHRRCWTLLSQKQRIKRSLLARQKVDNSNEFRTPQLVRCYTCTCVKWIQEKKNKIKSEPNQQETDGAATNHTSNNEDESSKRSSETNDDRQSKSSSSEPPRAVLKLLPTSWLDRPLPFLEAHHDLMKNNHRTIPALSALECLPLWRAEWAGQTFVIGKPIHPPVALYRYDRDIPDPNDSNTEKRPMEDPTPTFLPPQLIEPALLRKVQEHLQASERGGSHLSLVPSYETLRLKGLQLNELDNYRNFGDMQRLCEFTVPRPPYQESIYILVRPMYPILHVASQKPVERSSRTKVYGKRKGNQEEHPTANVLQLLSLEEFHAIVPRFRNEADAEAGLLEDDAYNRHGGVQCLFHTTLYGNS